MSDVQAINIIEDVEGELRVSSMIIAGRTKNQHASVLRVIREHQEELEGFGDLRFEILDRPGVPGPPSQVAHLNEPQSTLLMTFMRNTEVVVEFKVELVKQFYTMRQELANQFKLPRTFSEALRELATSVEKNAELEQKIVADEPKVDYVDTFVADNDVRLLRFVAQQLDLTESFLRNDLIERGWIYREHQRRRNSKGEVVDEFRYSAYSHKAKYFDPVPNHQAPLFKGNLMHTLKVTPQGAVAIARLYGKHLTAVEAVA